MLHAEYGFNPVEVGGGAIAQMVRGKAHTQQVLVKNAEGMEEASISVDRFPSNWLYSKSTNSLYLIDEERKEGVFITPVNLTTKHVDKEIKIDSDFDYFDSGGTGGLLLSGDGTRLFYDAPGHRKPHTDPSIYEIDTSKNEIVATFNYDWSRDFDKDLPKHSVVQKELVSDEDGSHLIAISVATERMKPVKYQLTVLSAQSSRPPVTANPDGKVVASMFSKDGKKLLAAIGGDKNTEGALFVLDLETGVSAHHALTDHPTRLFRLGSHQAPWILGDAEMRSVSEDGELSDRRIPLTKVAKSEEGGETGASAFMDGFPGETLSLADERAAIQINNKNGGSKHKVMLVDLKKLQVDAIIPTMSAGEIAGIRTGRYLAAFGLSMATGGTLIFIPNFTMRNESLAAPSDGRSLYALDLEGHKITVVDVPTATVVKRISVNSSVIRLQVSSDGKQVLCMPAIASKGKAIQRIDIASNNLLN
jgi:DNA-binding beta-propeller fold protein YncE